MIPVRQETIPPVPSTSPPRMPDGARRTSPGVRSPSRSVERDGRRTASAARLVVVSGCSSGGKSALLEELARRGHRTVEEPGRRVVRFELERGGGALPWKDTTAFARRCAERSLADYAAATGSPGLVFFDRSFIDAYAALRSAGISDLDDLREAIAVFRFVPVVFLAPPWKAIYVTDGERRHGFEEAKAEYLRLKACYPACGYRIFELPRTDVATRAEFVLDRVAGA